MRTVFVCLLTVVLAAAAAVPPVFTQSGLSKQEQKTAKTREKIKKLGVGSQAKVKVKLYTGTKYEGYVSLSDNDSFAIVDKSGTQRTVKYSDSRFDRRARPGLADRPRHRDRRRSSHRDLRRYRCVGRLKPGTCSGSSDLHAAKPATCPFRDPATYTSPNQRLAVS